MKNFYKVSNTIENGPRMDRVKSRISPINHRLWTVIAPMLLVAFGLFGVNETAWGYWHVAYYCSADAYVRPANTGYVWVTVKGSSFDGNFSQGEHDDSNHDDAIWGGGFFDGDKKAPSTYGITAQFYAKAENGDYKFKGWYNNEDGAGTAISTNTNGNCSYSQTINATKTSPGPNLTLYAIYAKYKTTTTEIDFGEVAYKSAAQNKTFTIDCHNVGTWSSPSGLSSVLSAALSGNSDNNTQQTCTVTVTLDPKTAGTYNQTLTVSTSRGGSIQVTVKANVTATPTYTWNTDVWNANGTMKRDVYVGETLTNVVTTPSSGTKTYTISGFTPSGTNNTGASTPTFTNNTLYCTQAGTLTLHINQAAETNGFDAGSSTVNITIKKRPNTLYANSDAAYHPTMQMGKDLAVTLTATNTDYTNSPIQLVEQTAGDNTVAVFDYTQNTHSGTVHSKYKKEVTATWSFHQDENYMYLAGNNTFSVDVKLASENTCYVLDKSSGTDTQMDDATWTYDIDAPGAVLSYKIKRLTDVTYGSVTVYGYDANENRTTLNSHVSTSLPTSYGDPIQVSVGQDIRKIEFYTGSYVNTKYVRDVKVTRKTYINAPNLTIDKTGTGNPVYPSDGVGVGTLTIDYSLANGGNLKIYNDNPKFNLSQSEISVSDCSDNSADITIQYESTTAGTDYAHLVIYNDVYRKEVTITGITSLRTQVVNWEVGDVVRMGSETENAAWVITGNTVNFSSSATDIIDVVDGKLVAKGVGSAVITATADAKGDYAAAYDTKTIEVTNDEIQWIDWNQTFLRLKLGGSNVTLTASAQSDVDGCTTDGARSITYSSANESIVRIVNTNQLQIVGAGTTVITATQAGGLDTDGHKYMAVSKEKTVIVRDPNAPCVNYLYVQPDENEWYCGWNHLNRQYKEFVIDNLVDPSDISLQYKGEYKRVALTDYFYGTMQVEEWYEGEWHDISGTLSPQIGNYQTFSHALNRNTTKVRISTHSGVGYHYFKDCKIGQARYIETNTLSAYEAKVGQKVDQTLSISYDNIVGDISLTLGHTPSNFSVSQNVITGDCGDRATVDVTVSYIPAAATVGEGEEETLTITDGTTTTHVNLSGSATVTDRYISWNQESPASKYTVESVTLTASALTTVGNHAAGDVFYTLGGLSTTGVLSGTNNSTLTFANAGVAYVSAQGKASALYNTPAAVTKQFNVELTPTEVVTAPTIGNVVSGTALSDITVSGGTARNTINQGSVSGTFTVQNGNVTDVGHRSVTVLFTPNDGTMYATCTYNMYVDVIARPATDEEIGTVTADHITFGDKLSDAVLSMSGTLNGHGTLEMTDPLKDDVKNVGTYENLKVLFTPDSEHSNIAPKELTVSVTVDKADPAVTPQATDITYGQPISASNITTASGDVAGSWAWAVDDTQVLSVGDHVLKANFTSDSANYNNLSNVDVTLKVKKIETLEVEVPLSFCAGGSETFHGKTYTTAGTDQINAVGATRDTVYNVTVTVLQPTTGTDSKTITVGDNESWNGKDLSGYAVGSHEVEYHTTNVAGCDSTVTLSLTVTAVVPVGPNTFTNNAGDNDWQNAENWINGVPSGVNPDVIISGVLIIDESVTVGGLTILPSGSVTVVESGTLTVNGESADHSAYGDLHVTDDGNVVLGNSADLKVRHFFLDAKLGDSSTQAASGQVKGNGALNVIGDAYFQMKFDPSGAITYGWYDFVVPFAVNITNGISRVGSLDDRIMVSGTDFLVQSFSETRCAAGQKAWTNFSGTMMPGQGYTITFNYQPGFDQNTFLFKKKAGAAIGGSNQYAATRTNNGSAVDEGWNVLGNGTLQHIELTQNLKIQVFEHASNSYRPFVSTEQSIAVGTSFQVQVTAPQNIVMSSATNKPILAPKYEGREIDEFRLSLTSDGEEREADRLWISASEEADGQYQIGHDLLKKGTMTSSKVARMWCERDGLKLCDIEMQMLNNEANSPLMLFAPQAGTYTLSIEEAPADANLYLTYNGAVIWDLTSSPYLLDLSKGTTIGYGLQIVAADAPQVTTGVENGGLMNDANSVRKVIIDNKMYIITPEGAIFDVIGKKVQ